MRVLHVDTGRSWRGGQRQTLLHLRYLSDQGWDGMLLARPRSDLWQKARGSGVRCFPWPSGDGRISVMGILWPVLLKFRPALIQLNDSKGLLPILLWRRWFKAIKVIAVRRVLFPVDRLSINRLYRPLDRIVCVSQAVHEQMCRFGLIPDQLKVIPDGADLDALKTRGDRIRTRRRLRIPEDGFHIGHVGRLSPEKGQEVLLEAANRLGSMPNLFFSFLGGGKRLSELTDRAQRLGIMERTRFLGHGEELNDYLASLDIYIQPSLTEGLGSAVIDAMANSLPVIGSRVGGIPELLGGGAGVLVPPGDPQALADAIFRLQADPDLCIRLGRTAFIRAQNYDFRKTNKRLLELYRELLS